MLTALVTVLENVSIVSAVEKSIYLGSLRLRVVSYNGNPSTLMKIYGWLKVTTSVSGVYPEVNS